MTRRIHYPYLDFSQPVPPVPSEWGHWTLDREHLVLLFENGARRYWVDLSRFNSSAEMLDMIMQVANKAFMSAEDVGDLVQALNRIFHPQGCLCSCGQDKRIDDVTAFLRARLS